MPKYKIIKIKNLKENIEDYRTTVDALLCFVSLTTWEPSSKAPKDKSIYSFGRHMCTSENNAISKNINQTPDLVVQVMEDEAYVIEAKIDLPKKEELWEKEIKQLQKYDDDLTGWWTSNEKVDSHDVVLLIEASRSRQIAKYADKLSQKSKIFSKPTAFIGFSRNQRVDENILFQLTWGSVTNSSLNSALDNFIPVPLEKVIASYGSRKFYDDKPEPEYLMDIMWTHLFTERKLMTVYDKNLKAWPFEVGVKEMTAELQKLFGNHVTAPRDDSHPCPSWVSEAMDLFVAIGLAEKIDDDKYMVHFKEYRKGDPIERFAKARSKANHREAKKNQQELEFKGKIKSK